MLFISLPILFCWYRLCNFIVGVFTQNLFYKNPSFRLIYFLHTTQWACVVWSNLFYFHKFIFSIGRIWCFNLNHTSLSSWSRSLHPPFLHMISHTYTHCTTYTVTHTRRTARALKKFAILASALSFARLSVRQHSLLVRRARWTNAMHSLSFAVCVGIFVHAQKCARSSTHECIRKKDAIHTRSTRWVFVVCSSAEV